MSDDKVMSGKSPRSLWMPARKANILKGLFAVLLGAILLFTMVPGSAQAKGPVITLSRVDGQIVAKGSGFTANAKGTVWAQVGSATAQKSVWTQQDGTFATTLYSLGSNRYGAAQVKAWVRSSYARNAVDLSRRGTSGGSINTGGSVAQNAANDSTTTTAAPAKPKAATPSGSAAAPSAAAPTAAASSGAAPAPAAPAAVAPSAGPGTGTGFADTPAGWKLTFADDFLGSSLDRSKWGTYDGKGNQGIGTRATSQVSVGGGELKITGNGTIGGGVASNFNQTYGLYEMRVRMDAASKGYNDAVLLWPSSEKWPVDGELDLQEMYNGVTSEMSHFAHWGSNNSQTGKTLKGDFSQWHTVAIDWEPGSATYYVDGVATMTISGAQVPTSAHFIAMQLDIASGGGQQSGAALHVDWVKAYTH